MKISELLGESDAVLDVINQGGALTTSQKKAIESAFFWWTGYEPQDAEDRIPDFIEHALSTDVIAHKHKELARKYLQSLV